MSGSENEKLGPWSVKGVPYEAREAFNAAAKRAIVPVGEWLVVAGNEKIATERMQAMRGNTGPTVDGGSGGALVIGNSYAPPGATPSINDLAALMRELPGLAEAKGCSGLAFKVRKIVSNGLAAYMPPKAPGANANPFLPKHDDDGAIEGR